MKNVILEMNELLEKSKALRSNAMKEGLSYNESQKIREEQTKVFNKYNFYKGFVKANAKKEGLSK